MGEMVQIEKILFELFHSYTTHKLQEKWNNDRVFILFTTQYIYMRYSFFATAQYH